MGVLLMRGLRLRFLACSRKKEFVVTMVPVECRSILKVCLSVSVMPLKVEVTEWASC